MKNALLKYTMALAIFCLCQIVVAQEIPLEQDSIVEFEAPNVLSLVLVNADTDEDIAEISEGSVFILEEIGTTNLNVRAEVDSLTESVVFDYQLVKNYHTENLPLYAIGANDDDDYRPWTPELGANTLTATAFDQDGGTGRSGNFLTVNFEILERALVVIPAFEMRINSGGPAVVLNDSIQFIADTLFVGSSKPYANNNILDVLETTQDSIYKTERTSSNSLKAFGYTIPVINGEYEIRLHFAEIYWGATRGGTAGLGKRVFNATIEGEEVITDFDISAEAVPMSALIKTFTATVIDSVLNIDFGATVNQPKISAIEIFREETVVSPKDCVWSELTNSTYSKEDAQRVKVENKLFVFTGVLSDSIPSSVTEVYDTATDTWSIGAPMPTAVSDMAAVTVNDEIWLIAGIKNDSLAITTNLVQVYNTITNTWSVGPQLPSARSAGAAAFENDKIHYFGGLMSDGVTNLDEHLVLDISDITAGWQIASNLPNPRSHISAAVVDGKIYALGGQNVLTDSVQNHNFLDEYNPVSDAWIRKADLPAARSNFQTGTIVHNNKIIIVGGNREDLVHNDISEYDVATDVWSQRCKLPLQIVAPIAEVFGDKLIVVNGTSTISTAIEPEVVIEEEQEVSILVYHETGGYRHSSIQAGIDMVNEFGKDNDWVVADSQTSDVFTVENLANYDVVIWMSTTGENILTPSEEKAFESFIQNGGGYVGVHSATDTYRNGSWSWYNDLVGAIVQVSPYHTSSNFSGIIDVVGEHASVAHLGANEWNKNDEYYYWERNGGYLYNGNIDLLQVRSTGANSYDAARPVTWYKEYDGGRSFYTALGHSSKDFKSDVNFRTMMKEAILWAAQGGELVVEEEVQEETDLADTATENSTIVLYPNPVIDVLNVDPEVLPLATIGMVNIFGMDGNFMKRKKVSNTDYQIDLSDLPSGYYIALVQIGATSERHLIYKQ
ncbi:ThuA domain-containing protein [Aurantibacter crassamenti]|uniref:ThuA domain-containing protein n=1 Tax=Aurantibacter crassamenti TaxID=1837375 RepID=UPI00193ACDDA|nr:ThuA domain-containing protein [Aurantibacter crassamenti]MBM1105618.1 ThuA domain-containing protein [Aurantibacter crassamenti]